MLSVKLGHLRSITFPLTSAALWSLVYLLELIKPCCGYASYIWSSFVHMPSSARLLQLSLHSLFPKVGRHLPLLRMTSWWPIANDKNSHGVVCSCKMKPNVNWRPALSGSIVVCFWWSCAPKANIFCLVLDLQEMFSNWWICSWPYLNEHIIFPRISLKQKTRIWKYTICCYPFSITFTFVPSVRPRGGSLTFRLSID